MREKMGCPRKNWHIALAAVFIAAASLSVPAADTPASSPAAAPPPSRLAVVVESLTSTPSGKGSAVSFQPGSIIRFDRSSTDGRVHIDSRATGIYQEGDIWIPRKYLATKESFTRVTRWNGAKHATYEDGPDVEYDYVLKPDGTFEIPPDDDSGKTHALTGRMYRFRNILWLRANAEELWYGAIFLILPNGDLCAPGIPACNEGNGG